MMLLLVLYNVRSERELMDTIPERLDWLWFLDYDLNDEIPNHSVLSKARNRWGVTAFKSFFERIVRQCAEAGLVDGSKLFMDSSMVKADASNNSVVNTTKLQRYLNKGFRILEEKLEGKKKKHFLLMIVPPKAEMPTKNISQPLIPMLRLSGEAKEGQSFSTRSTEGLMKNMKSLPQRK